MTRLNDSMRRQIVRNALTKAGITAANEDLNHRRREWAERVRTHFLGGLEGEKRVAATQKKIEKLISELPLRVVNGTPPWRMSEGITIHVAGQRVYVNLNDDSRIMPGDCHLDALHPLAEEWFQFRNEEVTLDERSATIREQVRAAVNAVTTVKALLREWPEAKELLPEEGPCAANTLPAVRIDELNALVGLPTKEGTA